MQGVRVTGYKSKGLPDKLTNVSPNNSKRALRERERERERERDLYFSVVTGTHYGTKTPPEPAAYEAMRRGMTRLGAIYGMYGMFRVWSFRVRCLVWYVFQ